MSRSTRIKKRMQFAGLGDVSEAQRRADNALSFLSHSQDPLAGLGDVWSDMNAWGKSVQTGFQNATQAVSQAAQQTIKNVQNAVTAIVKQDSGGVAPKSDPRIKATAQNFVDVANANLSKALGPELNAMAIVMGLNATQKASLVQSPINFFLHFFNPVIDYLHMMIDRVTKRTGKIQRKLSPISGNKIDMRTVQPQDAANKAKDPDTFDFYWTLRTIGQFIVICLTCPIIVADEAIKVMLKQPVGTDKNWDLGRLRRGGLGVAVVDDAAVVGAASAQTAGEATAVATATAPGWIEGLAALIKQLGDWFNTIGQVTNPILQVANKVIPGMQAQTPGTQTATPPTTQPPAAAEPDKTLLYAAGGAVAFLGILVALKD